MNKTVEELTQTPISFMNGEELLHLIKSGLNLNKENEPDDVTPTCDQNYVYGLAGLAELLNCSIPTALRIKQSGILNPAISQIGRKIIVNAPLALKLSTNYKQKNGNR